MLFCLCDYKVYRDGDPDERFASHEIAGLNRTANQALWENRQYRVTSDGSPSSMDFRMWGLATPQGLDPFLPTCYREMMKRSARFQTSRVFVMDYQNEPLLQKLGVRYAITYHGGVSEAFLSKDPAFRLVGEPDSFYQVYEYLNAQPPFGWETGEGTARTMNWMPERRILQVTSDHGGRFGFAEEILPGWQATVDGRKVATERWHEVFQAIEVAPGQHTVEFQYHSRLLPWGAAISLLSVAGLAYAAFQRPYAERRTGTGIRARDFQRS
jgi:hypothetical protein